MKMSRSVFRIRKGGEHRRIGGMMSDECRMTSDEGPDNTFDTRHSTLDIQFSSAVHTFLLILAAVLLIGCVGNGDTSDAYGNFEATETLIASEAGGKLLSFTVDEGETLEVGMFVALVDTVQLALKRDQLRASRQAVRSRISSVIAQIEVLQEQKRVAQIEKDRIEKLLDAQAATQKQLDDVDGQLRVLDRQIQSIRTQNATILGEIEVFDAQIAQLDDQVGRSKVVNPVAGTVLVTYAEPYEMTAPGSPLYKIADLATMYLRAYISGAQLPHVRIGQTVSVLIDEDETTNRTLSGEITWIASQAEFTPKLIQTKEERVNLVYAFKVRVANPEGRLKIGMPGEVMFTP